VKVCTACKNGMKALCKLDRSKYEFGTCAKCKRTFCDYCLICSSVTFTEGKKRKEKRFPSVCMECYRKTKKVP
jgi:hypothetical protein